jgi:hypothetical protein
MRMLFPKTIDNTYRGQWAAIPLLAIVVLMKFAMSFNAVFFTRMVIEQADKIPLDSYGAKAVPLIVYMFQAWAIGHFLLALLVAVALIRYRSMVPLATLFMLSEQAIRLIIRLSVDLPGVPHSSWNLATMSMGTLITRGLLAAMIVAFALSLWKRRSASEAE